MKRFDAHLVVEKHFHLHFACVNETGKGCGNKRERQAERGRKAKKHLSRRLP